MMLRGAIARSLQAEAPRFAAPEAAVAPLAKLLVERHGDTDRRRARDLTALVQRLRQVRFAWEKVSPADRLDVVWVLWDKPDAPAEHAAFLHAFLAWIDMPWRRVQACRLALAWACAFDPHLPSIGIVGEWLAARASRLVAPWPALAAEFEIFSPSRAPQRLADAFLAGAESEAAFRARLGLEGRIATGGLMLEALGAACNRVEAGLARHPQLAERLAAFAMHGEVFRPRGVRGSGRAAAIAIQLAEALLLPWQEAPPPQRVKEQIIAFLLHHYDDARKKTALWNRVRPEAAQRMRAWLTETTIDCFFRLAAKAKRDDPEQLRLRRQFWLSYRDRLDDAWLVAAREGVAALGAEGLGHGRLVGCRPDHGALLLKIGGMTIVETSHSNREHVWLPGNELAPRIHYRGGDFYLPAALSTGADFSSGYSCEESDEWQARLHGFIARHAGIDGEDAQA